jgi:hypothetical protein
VNKAFSDTKRGVAFVATFFLLTFVCGCNRDVPDAALRQTFFSNRDDFEKLVRMSEQDRCVVRIASDFTIMDTDSGLRMNMGLPQNRWEQYRVLFRKLGITDGLSRSKDFPDAVLFYAQCEGSAVDADCKGFAYSAKPLLPIENSLDKPRPGTVFALMSPNWYLLRWIS